MCELTFSNLHNAALNRAYLFVQMNKNATKHKDGFGLYTEEKGLYKSEAGFNEVVNHKVFLNQLVITNAPVMGHCRFATGLRGKVKVISDENSHPFETDKLVLIHNGVLEYKNKEDYDKYKDITVDSLLFLLELTEVYDGKNLVDALNKTMDKFWGVFCFIIYSKLEKKWFAVRGNKRILHLANVYEGAKQIGYVLNTEVEDLKDSLKRFCNLASLMTGKDYDKGKEEWFLLPETIYELLPMGVKIIGMLKEKEKPVYQPEPFQPKENSTVSILTSFMISTYLSFQEIDQMLYALYGEGLINISEDNLKSFIESIPEIKKHYSSKKKKIWDKIISMYHYYAPDAYFNLKIQCPYFMNSKQELITAYNQLKRVLTEVEKLEIQVIEDEEDDADLVQGEIM